MEQVKDGSTLRVRLLLPDGDHQFVNLTLAGVKSPRAVNKPEETPEQYGEEAGAINRAVLGSELIVVVGKVVHGATAPATLCQGDTPFSAKLICNTFPNHSFGTSTRNCPHVHWHRYVQFSLSNVTQVLNPLLHSTTSCWQCGGAPCRERFCSRG